MLCHHDDQLESDSSSSMKEPANAQVELPSKPNRMTAIAVYSIGVIAFLRIIRCIAPRSNAMVVNATSRGVECKRVVVMNGVAFGGGIAVSLACS